MKPRIVERPAFLVIGMRSRFEPGKVAGIPVLWERFVPRMGEVVDRTGRASYGVSVADRKDGLVAPPFHYTACVEASSLDRIPQGMTGFSVPAGTYAVFTHRGPITAFARTLRSIWQEWLPATGLVHTGRPDFELYDERYHPTSPTSEIDVYVPVVVEP